MRGSPHHRPGAQTPSIRPQRYTLFPGTNLTTTDDRLTLAVLGGAAYAATMTLHEGLGHGIGCLLTGGTPLISSVATQCTVQPWAMVLAGPLANLIVGGGLLLVLPKRSDGAGNRWVGLWLLAAFNLLQAFGYLLLGGAAGFGDWAVLLAPRAPTPIWRPALVILGAAGYYATLLILSRRLAGVFSGTEPERVKAIVWWSYLGGGLVGSVAGLFNPIDLTRRLIVPLASAWGASFGLTQLPAMPPPAPLRLRDSAPFAGTCHSS